MKPLVSLKLKIVRLLYYYCKKVTWKMEK